MTTRKLAIMTYGTPRDRACAAAMASLEGKSTSEWLLGLIRENYRAVYGDADPENLTDALVRDKRRKA